MHQVANSSTESLLQNCRYYLQQIVFHTKDIVNLQSDKEGKDIGQGLIDLALNCATYVQRKYQHDLNIAGPSYRQGDGAFHVCLPSCVLLTVLRSYLPCRPEDTAGRIEQS